MFYTVDPDRNANLFSVMLKTVIIFSPWSYDLQPICLYEGLKIVFLCPLSGTPSSMINPKMVNSAWFLF